MRTSYLVGTLMLILRILRLVPTVTPLCFVICKCLLGMMLWNGIGDRLGNCTRMSNILPDRCSLPVLTFLIAVMPGNRLIIFAVSRDCCRLCLVNSPESVQIASKWSPFRPGKLLSVPRIAHCEPCGSLASG